MSDSLLDELEKAADAALKSQSVSEGMKHLTRAFALFSKETNRLKTAYAKLQDEFKAVKEELENTHHQLVQKVDELNTVTGYLNNTLKNISQGIIFINMKGTITTFNEAAQKILGTKKENILFKRFWNFFRDDYFGFSMEDALSFGLSKRLNYITLPHEKQKKELEISTTFIFDGPELHRGIILLIRDVTEVRRLELIANQNNRMKELGEMDTSVAHEIRNPLGGIRGYASLLHKDLEGSSHLQEMANYIIEGTKSLEKLVSTVLHYARPAQIQTKTVEFASFLREICRFIKADPSFPKNVKLQLHLSHDPLHVPIDSDAMHSSLLNLIMNAFQAMPKGGNLTISLVKQDPFCVLSVSDTGIGIEPKDLENIFSPFFTTKQKGNGLGLSETYKIIGAHGGSIDVYSQPGRGSTFTITLPLRR